MNIKYSDVCEIQSYKDIFIQMSNRLENYINDMIHENYRLQNIYETIIEDYKCYIEHKCKIIVAYDDLTPIGIIVFWQDEDDHGYINILFLDDNYRHSNIGTNLFERVYMWFEKNEATSISVGTPAKNKLARKFYEKLGFIEESINYMYSIK